VSWSVVQDHSGAGRISQNPLVFRGFTGPSPRSRAPVVQSAL
jgi:hypothetical protein